MKRSLLLVLTLVAIVSLCVGCWGGIKAHTDVEKTIVTSVGQEFTIALDSNPTTGYDWKEAHDENALALVEDKYEPDEKAKGLVGAGGTQYYRLLALKEGETVITVTYQRLWEETYINQKVFGVNVRASVTPPAEETPEE